MQLSAEIVDLDGCVGTEWQRKRPILIWFCPSLATLGRFRIVEMLGEGQHATVYRAYDPVLERDVALKVPRQGVIKTAKGLERFLGEAKALARLRHPQIVPVYEAGCVGDRHYMAMALIEGCSLAQRMTECRVRVTSRHRDRR